MKKFIIKLLVFVIILLAIFAPINVIIDPYNIFHYEYPVSNGVEPNKNFIKTKYIINHQDEFDSLVFGSSRAGFMDVEMIKDGRYYDMASSEAVPAEHVNTLRALIKNGFIPKNILVMVDDISCFVDPKLHENMLFRTPYPTDGIVDTLEFYSKYCDLLTTYQALDTIRTHEKNDPDFTDRYRRTGTERLDIAPEFDGTDGQGHESVGYWADYYSFRLEEAINDIKELKGVCDEYGINMKVVTNPLYYKTYALDVENGYLDFLYELASVCDYYNFSSFSNVTMANNHYYETSHFTPEIGRAIIEIAYNDFDDPFLRDQGFGFYVTEANRDEFISKLKEQAYEYGVAVYDGSDKE